MKLGGLKLIAVTLAAVVGAGLIGEELYRTHAFLPAVKVGLVEFPPLQEFAEQFVHDDRLLDNYFASRVLAVSCRRAESDCFNWARFPRVRSVLTESAGLAPSTAVLLFRECPPSETCTHLEKVNAFVVPVENSEFAALLNRLSTTENCEAASEEYFFNLPIRYQVDFCTIVTRMDGRVRAVTIYAKVAQPHYARLLASVWFRSEHVLTMKFGERAIESSPSWTTNELIVVAGD